tara:strand:+ start:28422 stop:28622 length:201 start_codon:yes stop_codon:yes gene_type:complete
MKVEFYPVGSKVKLESGYMFIGSETNPTDTQGTVIRADFCGDFVQHTVSWSNGITNGPYQGKDLVG